MAFDEAREIKIYLKNIPEPLLCTDTAVGDTGAAYARCEELVNGDKNGWGARNSDLLGRR